MDNVLRTTEDARQALRSLERELANTIAPDYGFRGWLRDDLRRMPEEAIAGLTEAERARVADLVKPRAR